MTRARRAPPVEAALDRSAVVPALLLAVIVAIAFHTALRNGFTGWDDTVYIATNPSMRSASGLARIWTSLDSEQYYPLTFTSHWVEYQLWGANAAGFLAVNVVLHALNAVLVLLLLRALGLPQAPAWLGALVYAIHPTHAMSVAWIAERKNLLSCAFALGTLLAWIRFRRTGSSTAYVASIALFACALLSKTQVVGVVLVMCVLDACVLHQRPVAALARVLPHALLGVGALTATVLFEQRFVDPTSKDWTLGLAERVQVAGLAPWFYLWRSLLPFALAPVYPLWRPSADAWLWWTPWIANALVAVFWLRRRRAVDGRLLVAVALFVLPLAPTLGIVPFGNFAITHVSDHFLYVPLVGLAIAGGVAMAAAITRFPRAREASLVLAGGLGVLFAWRLRSEIPVFRDATSLWTRALERSPESYAAHLGLAEALRAGGDRAAAARHYERAIGIRPDWVDAHELGARAALEAGELERSERSARRALEIAPSNVRALTTLAAVLERTGRIEAALEMYEHAVATDPSSSAARMGLAQMYLGYGRYADAEREFRAILERSPDDPRARLGVATCLRGRGEHSAAVAWLRESVRRNASDWSSLNMLALLLATSRDDAVRRGDEALALAERAARGTHFQDPIVLDTLAAAQAEHGRRDEAARTSERAAVAHEGRGDAAGASESRRRAGVYASGDVLRR